MRKHIKSTILFFFIIFISDTIFAATQLSAIAKLSGLLNQFSTFQAQFKQKTTDAENNVLQESAGKMMLVRPGRFRWETNNPTHQIVITDGKTLWVYDVDLKQATKQAIQNSAINPAKLLSGDTNTLLKQFDVHMVPHQNILVFHLIPKRQNQQFRSVSLAFTHDKLTGMQIENNLEQTSQFQFSDIMLNSHLSPSLFKFKAPTGVDVIQ
ncbi:MAG: outer membrane lipoprotein carrier protein LolA [Gammaproteobacteria bacterium RIFCSPHIGHO2_12_FULL_40_19]|nr:MAG: outer membrane lipoprotein carrier protein LolA [Gammaproteobacteria bacterium RIFCSPHIGHO2_12_FULL_40_19]